MKTKEQIMDDIKIMSEEYIANMNNQIKSEDADFLRNLLNCSDHPFTNLTTEMFQTYLKKNADYGDSFSKSLNENGLVAAKVRLEDKFNRFGNLIKNEQQVNDESVEDTLLDMANYAIMTVMWMRNGGIEKPIIEKHYVDNVNALYNIGETVLLTSGTMKGYHGRIIDVKKHPVRYMLDMGGNDRLEVTPHTVIRTAYPFLELNKNKNVISSGDNFKNTLLGTFLEEGRENYLRLKEAIDKFEKKHKQQIKVGSVVKITEGHRTGFYDKVSRVYEQPLRYNLKSETSSVFYFPEELEFIHG